MYDAQYYQASASFIAGTLTEAPIIDFVLVPMWPLNRTDMSYAVYITSYNSNNQIVSDFSYFGMSRKACWEMNFLEVNYDSVCM